MNSIIKKLKKKNSKNRLSGQILMYCAAGLIVLLVVIALMQSRNTINEKQAELNSIKAMCDEQRMENDALRELMNNSDDDEYIERKAREDLDYVLPGERVYIIRSGN